MSRRYELLRTQSNEVLEALVSADLLPNDFDWEIVASLVQHDALVPRVFHSEMRLFFRFDVQGSGRYYLTFSPGQERGEERVEDVASWRTVMDHVCAWARRVKREVDAPDFWAEATKERQLSTATASARNSPFTPSERAVLLAKLDELETYVVDTHRLVGEDREYVRGQLEYLKGGIDRLGKKDWLSVFTGVLVGFILNRVVPPGRGVELLRFAWTLIQSVFGIPVELSPPA